MADQTVQQVSTEKLVCLPQVRSSTGFSDEEIAGLAQSIREAGGILQPLLVRRDGDKLVVLDGERRLQAARKAGLATVPVLIEAQGLSDGVVLHRQLVIDAQRVGLSPIERAQAIQRLMSETGWPAATVAVKLGLSPASVSRLLALLVLPVDVQKHVASGRIAMSTAYGLAKISDSAQREKLTQAALGGGLTREALSTATKALAAAGAPAKPRRPRPARERVVIPLGEGRVVSVSAPTLSVESVSTWLGTLAERMRAFGADGRPLPDVVKALSEGTGGNRG